MAHRPAGGNEIGSAGVDAAALQAEIEALRQRLAAVEARLPENAAAEPPERRQAIRQPRPQRKTGVAELEPTAAGRIARRRALGLGVVASLFAFIGRSAARAADALTIGLDGVKIDGPLTVSGKGGTNVNFVVNGRLQSNNSDGGLYVGAVGGSGERFVGGYETNKIGFYNNGAWRLGVRNDGQVEVMGQFVGKGAATLNNSLTVVGDAALSKSLTGSLLTVTAPGDPNDLNKVSHLRLMRDNSDKTGGKKVYLELYQDDPNNDVAEVYPSIRFHHNNKFWHRVEARQDGLHLKTGNVVSDDYQKLTVGDLAAKGNLTVSALSVPGGDEALRIVRGAVRADGRTVPDSPVGYKVTKPRDATGIYDIEFTTPFRGVPGASVTQVYNGSKDAYGPNPTLGGDTKDNAVIVFLLANKMRVKTGDGGGGWSNRDFSFIVIGPR